MKTVRVMLVLLTIFASGFAQEVADQSQTATDYGFWFERTVPRWQEFFPTFNNISAVSIGIAKYGSPGDLIAQIRTPSDSILEDRIVAGASIPSGFSWLRVGFLPSVNLVPTRSYRIYIRANADSPNPQNRYYWMGSTSSTYPGITSEFDGWPTFDYAFITHGFPQSDIEQSDLPTPSKFKLYQNYPNPFNAKTTVVFSVPEEAQVSIEVIDLIGRKVETIFEGFVTAGIHRSSWDSKNHPSGIYFCKMKAGDFAQTIRLLLTK